LRINPIIRRLITRLLAIIPAVLVIVSFGEARVDSLLVFSQVVLSVQLGFAIIPLIHFVSDKNKMGTFAIRLPVKILAWLVAAILIYLNVRMVAEQITEAVTSGISVWWLLVIVVAIVLFLSLFMLMTFLPMLKRSRKIH